MDLDERDEDRGLLSADIDGDRCDDCGKPNAAEDLTALSVPNDDGGTDDVRVCLRCEVAVVRARRAAMVAQAVAP